MCPVRYANIAIENIPVEVQQALDELLDKDTELHQKYTQIYHWEVQLRKAHSDETAKQVLDCFDQCAEIATYKVELADRIRQTVDKHLKRLISEIENTEADLGAPLAELPSTPLSAPRQRTADSSMSRRQITQNERLQRQGPHFSLERLCGGNRTVN